MSPGTGNAATQPVAIRTSPQDLPPCVSDAENWAALGAGALLLLGGAKKRPLIGLFMAAAATPLLYRGIIGQWPGFLAGLTSDDSKRALGGDRGLHVRESVRLDLPVADLYRFWRRFDNLPRFMAHLEAVTEHDGTDRSHWVAAGPAGLRVEWNAEIINEVENQTIGWRSLPGSDVVTAGSVTSTRWVTGAVQLEVHLQYAPPAGSAGAFVASLFGRAPEQTIREDLRRLNQLLEAGALAQANPIAPQSLS